MAHRVEITKDVEVGATPEEVWEAIATGPRDGLLVHGAERG
jgi:hypothetical protein